MNNINLELNKYGIAKKGGDNCDILSMSATPIPRTMMLSFFGDMDVSLLKEKPKYRKEIKTFIKPKVKFLELIPLIRKQISLNNQIFWVCPPYRKKSKKLNYSSAIDKYEEIKNFSK